MIKKRLQKPIIPVNAATLLQEERKLINFALFDYLGLSEHPETKKLAIKYLLEQGLYASSDPSEVNLSFQKSLEHKLATFLQRHAVVFFASQREAKAALLRHFKNAPKVIFAESVSSATGELTDLEKLAKQDGTTLILDCSHCLGVMGPDGIGLGANFREADILIGCLSKCCGSFGGFMACSKAFYESFIQEEGFSAHLPAASLGALEAALHLIPQMEGERRQLEQRAHWFRTELKKRGYQVTISRSPLIALPFATFEEADYIKKSLHHRGILLGMITEVAEDEQPYKILCALNVCHIPEHFKLFLEALDSELKCESHAVTDRSPVEVVANKMAPAKPFLD